MRVFDAVDKFEKEARVYSISCEERFFRLKKQAELVANYRVFEKYLGCDIKFDERGFAGYLLFEKYVRPSFHSVLQTQNYGLQLFSIAELAHSVQSLHEAGICHGALSGNSFFNPVLNLPLIAEPLGGCYPRSSREAAPEQLRYPDEVFPGTDVWHLADFLEMVRPTNRSLQHLIRDCRRHQPEARPGPDKVWEALMELHAKINDGERRERAQEWLRAGIRLGGLALCFAGLWWHLDTRFQARTAVAAHSLQTRMNLEVSRARRESFLKWRPHHLVFAGQEVMDLERLARQVSRFYNVPVAVQGGAGNLLVLAAEPIAWFELLEANQLDWEIDEHDEIKIFLSRRDGGGHSLDGDLLHQ